MGMAMVAMSGGSAGCVGAETGTTTSCGICLVSTDNASRPLVADATPRPTSNAIRA